MCLHIAVPVQAMLNSIRKLVLSLQVFDYTKRYTMLVRTILSKLQILKMGLRSSLTQDNLEALMLIAVEKDIVLQLKNGKERSIEKLAPTSKELSSLLLL